MSEDRINIRLRESNPYSNGRRFIFTNGNEELNRNIVKWTGTERDEYYTVRQEDDLDQIAWKMYGQLVEKPEWYWWVIADANNIENPLDITEYVGQQLVIPDIQAFLLLTQSTQ